MREIRLLRHGRTETNEWRVFTGAMDIPLSEGGRAALAARAGTYPEANAFFTSGMLRARQTLETLYGGARSVDLPDLGEYRFGTFENRGHDELYASEPVYRAWVGGDRNAVCPGGESMAMFDDRVAAGWRAVLGHAWDGLAVLVAHGGVICCILRQFGGNGPVATPGNGDGYAVRLAGSGDIAGFEAYP